VSSEKLVVRRSGGLSGRVPVPGDKSISHRALVLGGIADGASRVEKFLPSADCVATMSVMRRLGVEIEEHRPTTLIVHGRGLHGLREADDVLDCARSGTSMRLLAGLLAGQPFLSVLSGDIQLRRRPMGRIVEPLVQMGALVLGRDGGKLPPLAIRGGNLQGIEYALPVASAQVKSALLLAGLYAEGPTTLRVPGPARDHTERMLGAMGGSVGGTYYELHVEPAVRLGAVDMAVPGDMSSAAFLLVAATLVPRSEITVQGVGVNPTRTGLLDVLAAMRADVVLHNDRTVSGEPVADLTVRSAELHGTEVGGTLVVRAIDEFPVLAVAATQAHGETVVRDAAELRVKETDRIATTVAELRRMGAEIEARPDGFAVRGPTPLRGAEVHSHGDHRLGMALAVAGLVARGETLVRDTVCIGDSFPGFSATMVRLGGQLT
jgi:3-phosphoshikimate 1-carboxyvinyltransferase